MHKPKHFEYGSTNLSGYTEIFEHTNEESVNIHGLRGTVGVVPVVTAGTLGIVEVNWALICEPEIAAIADVSDTDFNLDTFQEWCWASGKLISTNNTPGMEHIELGTSRTCPKGSKVILAMQQQTAIFGTLASVRGVCGLTWWETAI